jgi:hypothetical protein
MGNETGRAHPNPRLSVNEEKLQTVTKINVAPGLLRKADSRERTDTQRSFG